MWETSSDLYNQNIKNLCKLNKKLKLIKYDPTEKDIKKLSEKNTKMKQLIKNFKINDVSKDLVLLNVQTNNDIMNQYLQDFIKLTDKHFDKFFIIDKYEENNNETESS